MDNNDPGSGIVITYPSNNGLSFVLRLHCDSSVKNRV